MSKHHHTIGIIIVSWQTIYSWRDSFWHNCGW